MTACTNGGTCLEIFGDFISRAMLLTPFSSLCLLSSNIKAKPIDDVRNIYVSMYFASLAPPTVFQPTLSLS